MTAHHHPVPAPRHTYDLPDLEGEALDALRDDLANAPDEQAYRAIRGYLPGGKPDRQIGGPPRRVPGDFGRQSTEGGGALLDDLMGEDDV